MAVDTTAVVAGTPSRNVPKTIGGQWQAVKPPWGRLENTVTDNHRVTAYFSNFMNKSLLSLLVQLYYVRQQYIHNYYVL